MMHSPRSEVAGENYSPAFSPCREGVLYLRLVEAFLAHGRETPVLLGSLIEAHPDCPRAHATKALMLVLLGRSEVIEAARESSAQAAALVVPGVTTAGDAAFAAAASAAANGAWWAAIGELERALQADPGDSLSAKMSHALRFMLGDKAGMLRSIERVLGALPAGHAHRGFLMGCHAFALEESGEYGRAETTGRAAVALEARDAWGLHAVSHVHEMTGRISDGIAWIEGGEQHIDHCNNFAGHLFWHLALFKLEAGAVSEVFALYDNRIRAEKTDDFRDIANGASLLARLEFEGHHVGARWEELADKAENRLADRSLVFADLHYLLALLGAGRGVAAGRLAQSMAGTPARHVSQSLVAERAGAATARGLVAFSQGKMGLALENLLASRRQRQMIGGSDAQRDVFEQMTIEAALGAGEDRVARSLLSDRLAHRHGSNRFAQDRLARLMRPMARGKGALGVAAALAFAEPAH
jgi:hypothetical protein